MPRERGLRLGGVVAALLVISAACGPPQPGIPPSTLGTDTFSADRQILRSDPAAQLRMPGADELQSVGAERHTAPGGSAPAFDGWIFGTQAAPAEVQAYYTSALGQQGWHSDTYAVYPTSTDLRAWGWCKQERLFRLAILDQTAFSPSVSHGRTYRTMFHATVNERMPAVTCPSQ